MAVSSALLTHKSFRYDVFVSFRGDDTRKNFVDHLYFALQQKNIRTFKDDNMRKGKMITTELITSIEDSKFYIIVFSKNYAASSWCLDELVKIMECHKTTHKRAIYPIFFDATPSDVCNLTGAVRKSFAKHKNEVSAAKWKEVLKEATYIAGWELQKTCDGYEAIFIQKVVNQISLDLRKSKEDGLSSIKSKIKLCWGCKSCSDT